MEIYNNTIRNINLDFSIVTMRRVAIIVFELEIVKNLMPKILIAKHFAIIFLFKNCAWLQQFHL